MASGDQCVMRREEMELESEEKAALDKLMDEANSQTTNQELRKEALSVLSKNEQEETKEQNSMHLAGVLKNNTTKKEALEVYKEKKWSGHFVKKYPKELKNTGAFYQVALFDKRGSEAGVVYKGKNKYGVECGWLLAWSASNAGKKVYSDCGPIQKFDNINWNSIKEKLDKSPSGSKHYDPTTGTTSAGAMKGTGKAAALGAYFSG